MTPRPSVALKQQRPLSAIYIGSLSSSSTPPDLPRLPEPPASPGGSSNASPSGLPSPPATNSTGSIGDESTSTVHLGSVRKRTSTYRPHAVSAAAPADMNDGAQYDFSRTAGTKYKGTSHSRAPSIFSSGLTDDEDEAHDNENDEDTTARFDSLSRRESSRLDMTASKADDHASALQRVKSLTERNRMVLNKLSSIQRLSSPSPSKPPDSPDSASPTPHSASRRPSTSTSRPPTSFHHHQLYNSTHSGSETERENRRSYGHGHSSSDSMSNTPTSMYSEYNPPHSASSDRYSVKQRRLSAPPSPQPELSSSLHRSRAVSPPPTPGPSQARTPRKRASVAATHVERDRYRRADEDDGQNNDVIASALAAVASSRNAESLGPSSSRGKRNANRQPLPLEFRDQDRNEADEIVPSTPYRDREFSHPRRSSRSPSTRTSTSNPSSSSTHPEPRSPRRHATSNGRTSTVRELTRKHQTRWLSEDLTNPQGDLDVELSAPGRAATSHSTYHSPGRRQNNRRGSMDSPLSPNKRLAQEGPRAAGVTKRHVTGDSEDVFSNGRSPGVSAPVAQTRRTRSTGADGNPFHDGEWESPVQVNPNYRLGGTPAASSRGSDPRTPGNVLQGVGDRRGAYTTPASRPMTSMASLHHDSPQNALPRTTPGGARAYRYPYDREASTSAVTLDDPMNHAYAAHSDRPSTSAYMPASGRMSTVHSVVASRDTHAEHRRLMLDALGMFQSQLSRLPPLGQTSISTIPDVFQNSQQIVHALDGLNEMLRTATGRALEAQIEAEVAGVDDASVGLSELWQLVGGEHREHLRINDEVVRTMTQFLLGVSKILRDSAATSAGSSSPSHLRSMSLDDDAARRLQTPDQSTSSDKRSSDGRRSRETRRSWDPREPGSALKERLANLARSHTTGSRPSSALHSTVSSGSRSTGDGVQEQTPPAARANSSGFPSTSSVTRRLQALREKRGISESNPRPAALMSSIDSQETVHAHEPSPTPASRQGILHGERTRALPPLAIPPSLSTLPSESLLQRDGATSASTDRSNRRKASTNSNITVRAEGCGLPPLVKPPNTTTAVTAATVSNAGSSGSSPSLSRADSGSSSRRNGITFSRPSNASLAALSGLQQQHTGQSRISRNASNDSAVGVPSPVALQPSMSGSETERPRTIGARGRASLDAVRSMDIPQQASTLQSTRKERRRTITEIFAQVGSSK